MAPQEAELARGGLTGSTIGRFAIGARLGSGGMGEVYRAEDTQLRRTVAIKRLTPQQPGNRLRRNELLREAQRASALNHPRIASIYDVFAHGDEFFLVMEYIDGVTLRQRMTSPFALPEFCDVAIQCAQALAGAHESGILHGDLKPANIMLTRGKGEVKVCDFGLARRVSKETRPDRETLTYTRPSGIAGTPAYMAPEVALEQPIDLRADIFSLGVVFFEMLAGSNPFSDDAFLVTLDRVRNHVPESLDRVNPQVPAKLARVIQKMIEKSPDRRYAAAEDIAAELTAIRSELPIDAQPVKPRGWWLWPVMGAAVLAAALGLSQLRDWRPANSVVTMPAEINLVVLPNADGTDRDKQFFSAGIVEALNAQLSRLTLNRKLQVATASDVRARGVTNPKEARDQFGANVAVSVSLRYSGDKLAATCMLVDTQSGRTLRKETFETVLSDPIKVQEMMVDAVVRMTGLNLTPGERAALKRHPLAKPGADDYYLQARGYLMNYDRLENLDSAIAVFGKALEKDSRYALAWAGVGQAYWRKYELTSVLAWIKPARDACERALAIETGVAEPHACMGMVLNGTGDYERAAEAYNLAVEREPTNDLYYVGLASAFEKLKRPADAEKIYLHAIDLRPHYWGGYSALGAYYYRQSEWDNALEMFEQVAGLAPDSFRSYSSIGALQFKKGNMREAEAAFKHSLAIRRNDVAASNLGTLYYFEGDFRRASDAYRQALTFKEKDQALWSNLGASLEFGGNAEEAASAYKRAKELAEERLRVNPRDAGLHLSLANYNAALGETEQARSALENVLKLAPAGGQTLYQLAAYYEYRLKNRDEALTWLAKAVEAGQPWFEIDHSPALRELRKDARFQKLRQSATTRP